MAEESEPWSSSTPLRRRECFEHLDCVDGVHYIPLWSSATLHTYLHLSVIDHMDDKRNNMASGLGALVHHMFHVLHFMLMHKFSLEHENTNIRVNCLSLRLHGDFSASFTVLNFYIFISKPAFSEQCVNLFLISPSPPLMYRIKMDSVTFSFIIPTSFSSTSPTSSSSSSSAPSTSYALWPWPFIHSTGHKAYRQLYRRSPLSNLQKSSLNSRWAELCVSFY